MGLEGFEVVASGDEDGRRSDDVLEEVGELAVVVVGED